MRPFGDCEPNVELEELVSSPSSTGQPAVNAKAHSVDFVQGDSTAENLVSGWKEQVAQSALKGRSGRARAQVDTVFGKFPLRQSGLHAVLKALAVYKNHGQSSGENPGVLFAAEAIDAWLKHARQVTCLQIEEAKSQTLAMTDAECLKMVFSLQRKYPFSAKPHTDVGICFT